MAEKKLPQNESKVVITPGTFAGIGAEQLRSAVIAALEDERFDWRTIGGLAKELGITEAEIIALLTSMPEQVVRASSPDGQSLYTTRNHYEKTHGLGDKVLSALADRIVA